MTQLGKVRYLLRIEGVKREWCTDVSDEATLADGRLRTAGLEFEGLEISERLNLREGTLQANDLSISIVSEHATEAFAKDANIVGILTDDIAYAATTINIESASEISAADEIHMGTETITVTNVVGTALTVSRQVWDTQAQGHYINVGFEANQVFIHDSPPSYEGRRAYLFRFTEGQTSDNLNIFDFAASYLGDTLKTSDNLIWRGIISQAPTLDPGDNTTWRLHISPITFVLEQEVAARSDERALLRGVYHHAKSELNIRIADDTNTAVYYQMPQLSTYFHIDDQSFVDDMNDVLTTLRTSAFVDSPTALWYTINTDSKEHRLWMVTAASSGVIHTLTDVDIISPLEGISDPAWLSYYPSGNKDKVYISYEHDEKLTPLTTYYKRIDKGDALGFFGANDAYFPWSGSVWGTHHWKSNRERIMTRVGAPRAWLHGLFDFFCQQPGDEGVAPSNKVYVTDEFDGIVSTGDVIRIETSGFGLPYQEGKITKADCTVSNHGDGWLQFDPDMTLYLGDNDVTEANNEPVPLHANTTFKLIRKYATGTTIDFLSGVCDEAKFANYGDTPFITRADVDVSTAESSGSYDLHSAGLLAGEYGVRNYIFNKPIRINEIVRNEVLFYGCCMRLGSDGRIEFVDMQKPTISRSGLTTINTNHIVTPGDGHGAFPEWIPAPDGVVSIVEITADYSDNVEGGIFDPFIVRDIGSISTHKNRSRATMEIEVKSSSRHKEPGGSGGHAFFVPEDAGKKIAEKQFAFHAHDYDVVKIPVTHDLMTTVFCGDSYLLTSPHIPNTSAGTMGVTGTPAFCIGRRWPLDPEEGPGEVEMILFRNQGDNLGYAPAARITSAVDSGGNIWLCTVNSSTFAAYGDTTLACFSSSDKVEAVEFNATVPGTQTGVVSAVTAASNTIRINFDGAAPWGAAMTAAEVYDVVFQTDGGNLNTGQTDYCYVSDSDGLLQDGSKGRRFS